MLADRWQGRQVFFGVSGLGSGVMGRQKDWQLCCWAGEMNSGWGEWSREEGVCRGGSLQYVPPSSIYYPTSHLPSFISLHPTFLHLFLYVPSFFIHFFISHLDIFLYGFIHFLTSHLSLFIFLYLITFLVFTNNYCIISHHFIILSIYYLIIHLYHPVLHYSNK